MATVLKTGNTYIGADANTLKIGYQDYTVNYTSISTESQYTNLSSVLESYIGQINNAKTRYKLASDVNKYISTNERVGGTTVGCYVYDQVNATVNYRDNITTDNVYDPGYLNITVGGGGYVVNMENCTWGNVSDSYNVPAIDDRVSKMRLNLAPVVKTRATPLPSATPAEVLAREALREVITEDEFRKYLKYGFVLVKGKSGATYQVYRNRSHVKVWVGGKVIEEVCVYLSAVDGLKAPDTDKVVAFKAMIEADEEAFKKLGNRYRMAA